MNSKVIEVKEIKLKKKNGIVIDRNIWGPLYVWKNAAYVKKSFKSSGWRVTMTTNFENSVSRKTSLKKETYT